MQYDKAQNLQRPTGELALFRAFFDNAPLGLHTLDADATIRLINNKWSSMLGYSSQEIRGRKFLELVASNYKERFATSFDEIVTSGCTSDISLDMIKKDGSKLAVSLQLSISNNSDDSSRQIYCFVHDLTGTFLENESAAQLAVFGNNNPAPLLRTDLQGRITLMNPAAHDLFGSKVAGQSISLILSGARAILGSTDSDNCPQQFEHAFGRDTFQFIVLKHAPTQSVYFYGSNITESKLLAQKLLQSEEKFRAICNSANEAIVMINSLGHITFWNTAAEKTFGIESKKAQGKHFHDMFVPEGYLDKHRIEFSRFVKTGRGPAIGKTLEVSTFRNNGTEFPAELSLSSVKLGDEWHGIGIIRDITERKARERELRKLSFAIEQSANTVVMTDTQGNIEYVNPKFTESTGYTAAEVVGGNPRVMKSGYTSGEAYQELWNTISSGKTWSGEFHNKKKNGELFWEKAVISPITDESGAIISYLAINEDITEQKTLEEERLALEVEMNQARKLEAVGSLAAGIAHEINTPIQFVGDNTNFLSDSFKSLICLIESYEKLWQEARAGADLTSLDQRRISLIERAELEFLRGEVPTAIEQTLEGVKRVTKIVGAMKNFAHSDKGEKAKSDINDMLESTLTVAQNELKYVAIVDTDFDSALPDIECYRDDLNQVFLNLLINAAHTIGDVIGDASSGKGVITVSTSHDDKNVVVKISDTGKGIPESIQDRIFDPFFSTKDVGKGSGQGLSIARKIVVEKHAGRLEFETEQGKGTTFIIRLPICSQEEDARVT